MAGRWQAVFTQGFTSVSSITVTHNAGVEYLSVRLIVGDEPRPDLLDKVIVSAADPTNELTVDLVSTQSGVIQILEADTHSVGAAPASRQYQAFTYGQHYTYVETLAAQTNATATLAQALRLTTPSVEAGDYMVSWSYTWNMNTTARSFVAEVEQNDTVLLWDMRQESKDSNTAEEIPASGFAQVTLAAGVHTFDIDYSNSGNGTARIKDARLNFMRVS